MSSSTRTPENYIVIGGSGFVGRHIVEQLLARGDTVSVFDIVQKYHDTPFYTGDITEEDQVADALQKVSKWSTPMSHPCLPAYNPEWCDLHFPYRFATARYAGPCIILEG